MHDSIKWLVGSLALAGAALLGNLAPRVSQSDLGLARELASQRALLSSLNKKLDASKTTSPAAPQTIMAGGTACDTTAVQAHVEASVREALAADRRDVEEEAKERGVSPDNAEIYAKADQWLETKFASKRWGSSDFAELQRASLGLSPEQRAALRHRVLKALNSGELTDPRFD